MSYLIIFLIILVLFIILKLFKVIKCNSVNMFCGAPKTGKSTLAVWLCVVDYKITYYSIFLGNIFKFILNYTLLLPTTLICKELYLKSSELPILYSNIPLYIREGYSPLTEDILKREVNPVENSRFYIGEFSLVANSMDYKDMLLNEEISMFFKLIGHQCKGRIFIDTQSLFDNHFAVKRCVNQFNYIHSNINLPFFVVLKVRELIYIEGMEGNNNSFNSDVEDSLKLVVIPKLCWRWFDYRCYSELTKNKPVQRIKIYNPDSLKANKIVSFREFLSFENSSISYNDLQNLLKEANDGKKPKKM